jgi:polysaccharide biosynthesis transport protein
MENELTFKEYLSILKRRWGQILATFLVLITIITIVIFSLPFVYKSEGKIAVEGPVVSEDIVRTGAAEQYADESVDKVRQKVLERDNLFSLNEKYNLFPGITDKKKLEGLLNKSISIASDTKNASANSWESKKITVGLTVGFKYSDPEVTYKVANEIVSQLLDENIKVKTKQAKETSDFLNDELNRLKSELEVVENKVADYKQQHANSLPEHQQMHMTSLDQLRTAIKDIDREYKTTQEELRYLDLEYTTTGATFSNSAGGVSQVTKVSELEAARAELDKSMALYKDTHPTIRALKRKIALLEQAEEAPIVDKPTVKNPAKDLALAKIQTRIDTAKARLDSLAAQKSAMNRQMAALQSQILEIPQVERGLSTLNRDYANAKLKYEDVKAKQINAKIAENLAVEDKGERFILKQSPEFPKYRESPKRTMLMALGGIVSLVLGLALAMLLEMLDPRVRGQAAVTSIIDMKLLAVIPYIETQTEVNKKRRVKNIFVSFFILIVILVLTAAFVHFFVTPLDTLLTSKK